MTYDIQERFWQYVDKGAQDECWEWRGPRVKIPGQEYGLCGGWVRAYRVSWEIHNGPIPYGMHVLHRCDNPPCVNPAHLYLGTHVDNMRDRAARKRGKEARQNGEANDNAKLTEAQVREIIYLLQGHNKVSQQRIADLYGVKQPQISRIARRESWAHLWAGQ
jgi:predicted XRE-type DNA-binding protein